MNAAQRLLGDLSDERDRLKDLRDSVTEDEEFNAATLDQQDTDRLAELETILSKYTEDGVEEFMDEDELEQYLEYQSEDAGLPDWAHPYFDFERYYGDVRTDYTEHAIDGVSFWVR